MQTFQPSLRLAWWKMTIRRQDSAHIFSVAESFSNYSQDQDPMSSFVIGTKITVLWCTKCYYHDSHNDDDDDGGDGVVRQWFLGRMIRSGWRREVASEPFPSRPEHQLMIQKFLLSLHHSFSTIGHQHYQDVSSLENSCFISWHWLVVCFFPFEGVYIFCCDWERAYQLNTNLRRWKISARIICLGPAQEPTIVGAYWQVQSPVMGITHKVA